MVQNLDVTLDESVERFLKACKLNSQETYRSSLKHFAIFIKDFQFQGQVIGSPNRFLDLVSADQAKPVREKQFISRDVISAFREYLENLGYHPKGILTRVGAVQSYGKYYEISIGTKYTQMPAPVVQSKSYPWTTEMFERFINLSNSTMYRALISLLYQSGLGIGDVVVSRSKHPLLYQTLKDDFEAGTVPVCIDMVRHKTAVDHYTFISSETVTLLQTYFQEAGTPKPKDPVFPVAKRSVEDYFALRARTLLGDYGNRNPMAPHSLRKFFRKSVVNAGCPESYAEYWEGHNLKADLRKTYTAMSKEEWAEQYQKYMPTLAFKIKSLEKSEDKT